MPPRRGAARLALPLAALVVGLGSGIASTVLHNASWGWFLLAAIAPLVTTVALPAGWSRVLFVGGWLAALVLGVLPRPEGDYLVAADPRGHALLGTGLFLLVVAFGTLRVRRKRQRRDESGPAGLPL